MYIISRVNVLIWPFSAIHCPASCFVFAHLKKVYFTYHKFGMKAYGADSLYQIAF